MTFDNLIVRVGTLVACLTLMPVSPAQAWGRYGHAVTGHVAEAHLSPASREAVAELLDGRSLAEVASWADEVRPDWPETAPFHFINGPMDALEPTNAHWHLPRGNVHSAILAYAEVLANQDHAARNRREALKFLVHFIGDLHQPLHAGFAEDRGGNNAVILHRGEVSNLHRYWDVGILDTHASRYDARQLAAVLQDRYRHELAELLEPALDSRQWVRETRGYLFSGLYPLARSDHEREGIDQPILIIDETYESVWLPVAERQLLRAGLRLAASLNALFDAGQSPFEPARISPPERP
ncbi:MAG: S1/P1 nuclease [Wenzhouxiangella sp.]